MSPAHAASARQDRHQSNRHRRYESRRPPRAHPHSSSRTLSAKPFGSASSDRRGSQQYSCSRRRPGCDSRGACALHTPSRRHSWSAVDLGTSGAARAKASPPDGPACQRAPSAARRSHAPLPRSRIRFRTECSGCHRCCAVAAAAARTRLAPQREPLPGAAAHRRRRTARNPHRHPAPERHQASSADSANNWQFADYPPLSSLTDGNC